MPDTIINKAYSKFQISKFLDDKKNYQVVVRTNDFPELLEAMKDVAVLVKKIETQAEKQAEPDAYNKEKASNPCPNCGATMKISSKGKAYCSALCWKT